MSVPTAIGFDCPLVWWRQSHHFIRVSRRSCFERDSPIQDCERSSAAIELQDLNRLSEIARSDLQRYLAGDPGGRAAFSTNILCVALCQGAAQHYLDKTTGVKDFDIFTFFGMKDFPPRRRTSYDFGHSKFGRHPGDAHWR
jgi:hypothetical protein